MPNESNVCSHHEALCKDIRNMIETQKKMNGTMSKVNDALGDGKINFATMKTRLSLIEKIVFGAVGLILTGFIVAIIALVTK